MEDLPDRGQGEGVIRPLEVEDHHGMPILPVSSLPAGGFLAGPADPADPGQVLPQEASGIQEGHQSVPRMEHPAYQPAEAVSVLLLHRPLQGRHLGGLSDEEAEAEPLHLHHQDLLLLPRSPEPQPIRQVQHGDQGIPQVHEPPDGGRGTGHRGDGGTPDDLPHHFQGNGEPFVPKADLHVSRPAAVLHAHPLSSSGSGSSRIQDPF